jgi:hypothetical protein
MKDRIGSQFMGIAAHWITFVSAAAILLAHWSDVRCQETQQRPNIVFAIADDWGWPHAGA